MRMPVDGRRAPVPVLGLRPGGAHTIAATTGASARNATAFTGRVIRVHTTIAVYARSGDATVTASSSDHYLPPGSGDLSLGGADDVHTHLAVRAVSTDGAVYISEMA